MPLNPKRKFYQSESEQAIQGGSSILTIWNVYVFPECVLKFELVDRELIVCLQASFPVDIFFGFGP